ncbi:MAG: VOC family protein [Acidimicrobiales bacterium]
MSTTEAESTTAAPPSLLTHLALPVRDLDATLAFYRRYTTLKVIHERYDDETKMRTAWLANEGDVTVEGAARFVIVLMEGALPRDIVGDDMEETHGFLTSISHIGLSLDTRDEVDAVAALAAEEGCLLLGPLYRNEVVGYICIVTDPDGNNVEFSVGQVLG